MTDCALPTIPEDLTGRLHLAEKLISAKAGYRASNPDDSFSNIRMGCPVRRSRPPSPARQTHAFTSAFLAGAFEAGSPEMFGTTCVGQSECLVRAEFQPTASKSTSSNSPNILLRHCSRWRAARWLLFWRAPKQAYDAPPITRTQPVQQLGPHQPSLSGGDSKRSTAGRIKHHRGGAQCQS